ncbi:hypothetical protein BURKHO8Y_120279 [Burkholderia sp. 8Y]|nr:hypothetical protein BURKHO8Y_120279 [Burkholderia sp. 8Y]
MVALVASHCSFVYITGDANRIADSGNHSGTLSVPNPHTTQTTPLFRAGGRCDRERPISHTARTSHPSVSAQKEPHRASR